MVSKIDHIGIVVKSLEDTLKVYGNVLGLPEVKREKLKTMNVEVVFVKVGEVLYEFLEPKGPGAGMIGDFLKENGEGFHHIALRVEDLQRVLDDMKKAGIPLQDEQPKPGADDSLIVFLEPTCTQNVYTELVERKGEVGDKV